MWQMNYDEASEHWINKDKDSVHMDVEDMEKLEIPMHLIKVVPTEYDYLDSALKKEGYSIRQHLAIRCKSQIRPTVGGI